MTQMKQLYGTLDIKSTLVLQIFRLGLALEIGLAGKIYPSHDLDLDLNLGGSSLRVQVDKNIIIKAAAAVVCMQMYEMCPRDLFLLPKSSFPIAPLTTPSRKKTCYNIFLSLPSFFSPNSILAGNLTQGEKKRIPRVMSKNCLNFLSSPFVGIFFFLNGMKAEERENVWYGEMKRKSLLRIRVVVVLCGLFFRRPFIPPQNLALQKRESFIKRHETQKRPFHNSPHPPLGFLIST